MKVHKMNNLSQEQELLNNEPKNNEIHKQREMISEVYNKFQLIGMVTNDLKKEFYYGTQGGLIKCSIILTIPNGNIMEVVAVSKNAEEIATIYHKGDLIAVDGVLHGRFINEEYKLNLLIVNHKLVKKNLNIESIKQHEYHFQETEQLYDPFKVKDRMTKGENNNDR